MLAGGLTKIVGGFSREITSLEGSLIMILEGCWRRVVVKGGRGEIEELELPGR